MVIRRMVRMTFRPEALPVFDALFARTAPQIRAFAGCLHLELWHDPNHPHIRMTYSHWQDAAALDAYRHSALFRETWAQTKVLFAEKPLAFSGLCAVAIAPEEVKG